MVFELFKEYSTVETFTGRPILGQEENPTKNEKLENILSETNNLIVELNNNGVENKEANDKLNELKDNIDTVKTRLENEDLTEEELEEKVSFYELVLEKIKDLLRKLGILSDEDSVVNNAAEEEHEHEHEQESENKVNNTNNYEEDTADDEGDDEGNDQEGDDEGDDSAFDESGDIEGFTNQMGHVNGMTGMKKVLSLDLFLRSVLYACLFYLLAHPDTFKFVGKIVKRVPKSNLLYVHMAVFAVLYYLLNLFI